MEYSFVSAEGVRSPVQLPRLVFFTAATSGACRNVEGWIAAALQRRRNYRKIKLVRVDAHERPDLIDRFRIERLPTLLVVEDKSVRARLECPRGTGEITELLAPWLL